MHHLRRLVLPTLLLATFVVAAPGAARAGDVQPHVAPAPVPTTAPLADAVRDRLFVLEHELHALEAEILALRERLARLEARLAE